MLRNIVIGSLAAVLLGGLPVLAQEAIPPLAGGPGSRAPEQNATLRAEQARLARQAEAQKAEQDRLDRQAEDLRELEARLKAREADLAAEEKRLAQIEAHQKADNVAALAGLIRDADEAGEEETPRSRLADRSDADHADPDEDALEEDRPAIGRTVEARLDFDDAWQACSRAGEDAALARNFYSARYDSEPNLYRNGGWQMSGWMRLSDRRGYVVVRTVCALDNAGDVQHFAFLR
jgi:hypothetical protein